MVKKKKLSREEILEKLREVDKAMLITIEHLQAIKNQKLALLRTL